jgi:hypothetical protein
MTEREEERAERGFVVIDRRASAGGADREHPRAPAEESSPRGAGPASDAPPPSVDFAVLVYSFATSALHHMGFVPDPETGRTGERSLPLARQNIEILELIEQKTRGNLETEEARLLESLLYEVRMRFVEASRSGT